MAWGGRCPQCKQPFRGLRDGVTMGSHRTEFYAPFSNRRERCPYSGGTVEDARNGISPLLRRMEAFQRKRKEWGSNETR